MITLSEAEEIREQFKPAFAGYLTDGDISDRDVLATLLDLSVRGYIKLDMERKGGQYEVKKVIKGEESTKGLLPFEKEFLDVLFLGGDELIVYDVQSLFYTGSLHNIIEENLASLAENEIIKSELEFKTPEGKTTGLIWKEKPIKTVEELRRYKSVMGRGSVIVIVLLLFGIYVLYQKSSIEPMGASDFLIAIVLIITIEGLFYIHYIYWSRRQKKMKTILHVEFGDAVPFSKKKYEELFEFIQEYLLKEQRIYNEFMPFAVAFGLDTSWNKSFRDTGGGSNQLRVN